MIRSAWLIALVACGQKSDAPPAPPPKPIVPPADAGPPAPPKPIPGSWPNIEPTGPCSFKMLPRPEAERARMLELARARLGRFEGVAKIELTKLAARVARVDWTHARPAPAAPNAEQARTIALDLWKTDGDLFGLEHFDLDRLETLVTHVDNVPGIAWEIHGMLERPTRLDTQPASTGHGQVLVDLDRLGRLVTAKVDDTLLPPLTVCTQTLERAQVEHAIAGASLEWNSSEGHQVEGKADVANIRSIERTLMERLGRDFDPDGPDEYFVVYLVVVALGKDRHETWSFQVDPVTAKIIGSSPNFMD
jgi:hypothetical protein